MVEPRHFVSHQHNLSLFQAVLISAVDARQPLSADTGCAVVAVSWSPVDARMSCPAAASHTACIPGSAASPPVLLLNYVIETKLSVGVRLQLLSSNLLGAGEGLITYMRTDGVAIGPPAVQDIRQQIKTSYGQGSLAAEPRVYKYALGCICLP